MVFTGNIHPEEFVCTCSKDIECNIHKKIKAIKSVRGKRTSEGYKPEPNEKVELKGD